MKFTLKIAVLFFALLIVNCSSDDDSSNSNQEFSPELLNGTWRISLFTDESSDRTSEFSGYQFVFNIEEESVIVTYDGNSEAAFIEVFQENNDNENIWVVYTDFDDNPGTADLDDLVEDWFVTKVSNNAMVIELEELYSNNTAEILHFTKISNDN